MKIKNMKITLNDRKIDIKDSTTLFDIVSFYKYKKFGFAISVNNVVIPKPEWSTFKIKKNDTIILFQAISGG